MLRLVEFQAKLQSFAQNADNAMGQVTTDATIKVVEIKEPASAIKKNRKTMGKMRMAPTAHCHVGSLESSGAARRAKGNIKRRRIQPDKTHITSARASR